VRATIYVKGGIIPNKGNVMRMFYDNFEWLFLFLGGGEDSGLDSAE